MLHMLIELGCNLLFNKLIQREARISTNFFYQKAAFTTGLLSLLRIWKICIPRNQGKKGAFFENFISVRVQVQMDVYQTKLQPPPIQRGIFFHVFYFLLMYIFGNSAVQLCPLFFYV